MIAAFILTFLIGRFLGWRSAHLTIARECKRLGSFYVNNDTFHCTKIEQRSPSPKAPKNYNHQDGTFDPED